MPCNWDFLYLKAIRWVVFIDKLPLSSNIRLAMLYNFAQGTAIKEQSRDGLNNS